MRIWIITLVLLRLVGGGCEPSPGPTGSEDVFVLPGAEVSVTTLSLMDNALVVSGTIKNSSSSKYSPYWYVEADFYADSTFSLKLGGAAQTISYALDPGESTLLNIRFRSTTIDVNLYPDFRIRNTRAYRKND